MAARASSTPAAGGEALAAISALRAADPVLGGVIDAVGAAAIADPRRGYPRDHFGALVRAILGQQVSVAAAAAMYRRLLERFGGRTPTPQEVLADEPGALRAAVGLSRAKVVFLRSLAERVVDGELDLDGLERHSDDEVLGQLTAIKGIGVWTAQIFLMLHLERPDVVASGDLGIRRAVMIAYGLDAPPTPDEIDARAEAWRPFRTLACRVLWASQAGTPL
ncbi:MAG: DNA-3-methyladenine glycosylase 2 family protein [Actinomycetota bacterium]|nr:DNA-3-methyladenine glycosylase 2 family protein [Actinomycetota bacterium]